MSRQASSAPASASVVRAPWVPADPSTSKLLTPPEKVIPVVGAGVSKGAGLPDGSGIVQRLCTDFSTSPAAVAAANYEPSDPRDVADYLIQERSVSHDDVRSSVAQLFTDERRNLKPTDTLNAIASAPSYWALTFCYDDSIEQAARLLGRAAESHTLGDLPWLDDLPSSSKPPLKVLHLHGYYDKTNSIILSQTSGTGYPMVSGNDQLKTYLATLVGQYNLAFIGTTLDELYIIELLGALRYQKPKHVLFAPADEVQEITKRRARANQVRKLIIEEFPKGGWDELDRICQQIFTPIAATASPITVKDFSLPLPVTTFATPTLVPAEPKDADNAIPLAWSVELGRVHPVAIEELAVKSQTLIVGRPGSGKTQLLLKAAASVPQDEQAIYIRLASQPTPIGDPIEVLLKWARAAQPSSRENELTSEDFHRVRFHFLLDGFDEVPSSQQPHFASRIIAMARELPQHRFTVTSRLVPGAEAFDAAEWERLELTTTSRWRDEFLAQFGLTFKGLMDEAPVLQPLGELLSLPFYLNAVVELRKAGKLPESGDLMTVAEALVDQALNHEDVTPVRDVVRPWLQEVGLVMQMAGRPELTIEELKQVPLPEGFDLGSDDSVLDVLTRRSLLEYDGEHVRFVHRLIADALTAEKLIELDPENSGLLDVSAPRTDEVSGLRGDWSTVMLLVGSRSDAWRTAIAERDPLAAARMVPTDATAELRGDAARTLWGAYVKSSLWMHTARGPGVFDDAEIAGRLLRSGDLPDVVDEVLGGIHDPSPQVRSNALEVLGAAQLDGELGPLVRATLAGDPKPVVRRQASGVALDRNLKAAFALVRHRALTSDDELEQQDLAMAGMKLASPDELLAFALALAKRGLGRYSPIEQTVRDQLGAAAALKVLRAQAEHGDLAALGGHILTNFMDDLPDDAEATEDIAFLAVLGGDPTVLTARLKKDPEAAMRGLIAGLGVARHSYQRVAIFAFELPDEILDNASFRDEHQRDHLLKLRELWRQPAPPPEPLQEAEDAEPEAEEPPPSLAQLLGRTDQEADNLLLANTRYFANQVSGLTTGEALALEERIRTWWPEGGLQTGITEADAQRFTISARVLACLTYGSQLKFELSDSRWLEVAQAPPVYEGGEAWLRARYRPGAALQAARSWQSSETKPWARLVTVIPGKLPRALVSAIAASVKKGDDFGEQLLARLWEERHLSALRKLTKVPGDLGTAATYYMARAGDVKAQRTCLDTLISDLATNKAIHSHELQWLEGISDPRLLERLFEALVRSYHHANPGHSSFNDTMEPIHNAIRRIGGIAAIERYNELMARQPPAFDGVQFEALQRDGIVHDLLQAVGDSHREDAMTHLGLPLLETLAD